VKTGFIGLGTMGFPMAGHLLKGDWDVVVFNRNKDKSAIWCETYNAQSVDTVSELARQCDVIIACVGNDNDVREIFFGEEGVLDNAREGSIVIDHTTTSAELAREIDQYAHSNGLKFLDAPVSGGEAGAVNGCLAAMIGGDEATLEQVKPVLETYCQSITHMGVAGSGQLCKMVNQLCIAGILQGLSEGMTLAERSGLDAAKVVQAISGGAAGSWQMLNRAETMSQRKFDFGFAIDWMRKDLDFCFDEGEKLGVELPCAKMVDEKYASLQAAGEGRSDTSVLIKQFDQQKH